MLRIIISPAKKMNIVEEAPAAAGAPLFLEQAEELKKYLQSLDYETLKGIWKCNDKLAKLNYERVREMDLKGNVTPAVFSYEGIQYQSMAPMVFEQSHLDYIEKHLYILSGFYGILRAFDGVAPYRLEMQAKLQMKRESGIVSSLYEYWGSRLYQVLAEEEVVAGEAVTIVNLASQEYGKVIKPWVGGDVRMVECVFGELEDEKIRVKATAAKMARGAMVRYMAEHQVQRVEELKAFDVMGYQYRGDLSGENTLVFIRNGR